MLSGALWGCAARQNWRMFSLSQEMHFSLIKRGGAKRRAAGKAKVQARPPALRSPCATDEPDSSSHVPIEPGTYTEEGAKMHTACTHIRESPQVKQEPGAAPAKARTGCKRQSNAPTAEGAAAQPAIGLALQMAMGTSGNVW